MFFVLFKRCLQTIFCDYQCSSRAAVFIAHTLARFAPGNDFHVNRSRGPINCTRNANFGHNLVVRRTTTALTFNSQSSPLESIVWSLAFSQTIAGRKRFSVFAIANNNITTEPRMTKTGNHVLPHFAFSKTHSTHKKNRETQTNNHKPLRRLAVIENRFPFYYKF